ncbi:MAG: alpha/beta fold hydrolase [Parvularculaceae bacterium]
MAAMLVACSGGGEPDSGPPPVAPQFTVTATAEAGGAISPATATVASGATATFTVAPGNGFDISSVSGCGGSLNGATFTTGPIKANCGVSARFGEQAVAAQLVLAYGDGNRISTVAGDAAFEVPVVLSEMRDGLHLVLLEAPAFVNVAGWSLRVDPSQLSNIPKEFDVTVAVLDAANKERAAQSGIVDIAIVASIAPVQTLLNGGAVSSVSSGMRVEAPFGAFASGSAQIAIATLQYADGRESIILELDEANQEPLPIEFLADAEAISSTSVSESESAIPNSEQVPCDARKKESVAPSCINMWVERGATLTVCGLEALGWNEEWFGAARAVQDFNVGLRFDNSVPARKSCPTAETEIKFHAEIEDDMVWSQLSGPAGWETGQLRGARPILLIHGYEAPLGGVGGGPKYWLGLNDILKGLKSQDGKQLAVFTFQWHMGSPYQETADDLIDALARIVALTGSEVTIIAHSFGGLVARTAAQSPFENLIP